MIIADNDIASDIASLLISADVLCYYQKDNMDSPYCWSSGLLSPCYPDHRLLLMHPDILNSIISQIVFDIVKSNVSFDFIASMETAGVAFGVLIANKLNKPFCYVKKNEKTYGIKNQLECVKELPKNFQNAIVFDEVFSTGSNAIKAAIVIREMLGVRVTDVFGITNNMLSYSKINFEKYNLIPHVLTDLSFILDVASKTKYIDEKSILDMKCFLKDPQNWAITKEYIKYCDVFNYYKKLNTNAYC